MMKKIILLFYLIALASVVLANIPKIIEFLFPPQYLPQNYKSDW